MTYKGAVFPWHCDEMGHMNVMWYVGKFDEATRHLFHAVGLTPAFLRDNNRGMAAVEQHISYKRELLAGDIIEIHSQVIEIKDKSLRFAHEMRNIETSEVSATTELTGVFLDKAARRACGFPPAIRKRAATLQTAR